MKFGEKNVGMVDRVIRIVIGFLVIGYGAKYIGFPLNLVIAMAGFVIVATGAIGTCTLYSLIGIDTLSESERIPGKPAAKPATQKSRKKQKE
jgi:hypothetical protein